MLASLGTFHQLWVSKDEYEEHGMSIVHQSESTPRSERSPVTIDRNADGIRM